MTLEDLGKTIAKFAPALGTAIAGPVGTAIGSVVAAAFGGDINNPQELSNLIQSNPDAALKLIELQNNLIIDRETLEANDRDSARKREMTVKDHVPAILAFSLIGLYAIVIVFALTVNDGVMQGLQNLIIMIISYYFGSSIGSRNKETIMQNLTK